MRDSFTNKSDGTGSRESGLKRGLVLGEGAGGRK